MVTMASTEKKDSCGKEDPGSLFQAEMSEPRQQQLRVPEGNTSVLEHDDESQHTPPPHDHTLLTPTGSVGTGSFDDMDDGNETIIKCPKTPETANALDEDDASFSSSSQVPQELQLDMDDNVGIYDLQVTSIDRDISDAIHYCTERLQNDRMSPEAVKMSVEQALRHFRSKARRDGFHSVKGYTLEEDDEQSGINNSSSSRPQRSLGGSHKTSTTGIHKLCVALRDYPVYGISMDDVPTLLPKIHDFHIARYLRRKLHRTLPWGVLGLFLHIADMKLDLEWVEDSAWHRQHGQSPISWSTFTKRHSHNDHSRTYFVYLMHFLSVIFMILAIGVNDWSIEPLHINPLIGPSAESLLKLGALNSDLVMEDDEWYRLITPLVLHAGLIHLLINVLALHFIGGAVERVHGTLATATIFVISGVGGNIFSVLMYPGAVSVGASGGLFGILGLCLASIGSNWDLITLKNHCDKNDKGFRYGVVLLVLFIEISLNMIVGLTPYVDNFAHLGGLLYGILLGFPILTIDRAKLFGWSQVGHFTRSCHIRYTVLFRLASFSTGVGLLIWSLVALVYHNDDSGQPFCDSCRYISCAPFPFWGDQEPWWYCDDCNAVSGTFVRYATYTELTFDCPKSDDTSDEPITLSIGVNMTKDDIAGSLPGYCREWC